LIVRRMAFWFTIFGPLLLMAGHVALHAVRSHDLALMQLVGAYMSALGLLGATALPMSPFWAAVVIGSMSIARGRGWLV
jgi:hypothetical protein